MVRTYRSLHRSFLSTGLVVAAWILLTPGAIPAQSPNAYIPPDAKGFRALQMRQQMIQEATRLSATVASHSITTHHAPATQPADVQISINIPGNWNPPAAVAIQGLDGEVRNFAVEGGRQALHTRVVVVRPGDRVTVQLTPVRPPVQR